MTAASTAVLLALAGCASTADANGTPAGRSAVATGVPADGYGQSTLLLRVAYAGGFVPANLIPTRLPLLSVYADGRVFTQGPQIEIFPPPALPGLEVRRISPADARRLVDLAVAAGVGGSADYGQPGVADAPSTRFTVRTDAGIRTTEVYALGNGDGDGLTGGLTAAQIAARRQLWTLLSQLNDLPRTLGPDAVSQSTLYAPSAIAAVVEEWRSPGPDQPAQEEKEWPGPTLPGPLLGGGLELHCVTASGAAAARVASAATHANTLTPWRSGNQRWTLTLRPLLPDERDCADLRGQS
ncbi:hypothetical protein ACFQX7_21275 [Luedemannella flava]|uniref:hypothetical protein n=1 Tax=Luedemannella flava TaxID=349316 RepID=UPI0031D98F78